MNTDRFGRQRDRDNPEQGSLDFCPTAVQCKIRSYAQFSRWLDGELAKLERRWAHLAAHRRPVERPSFPTQPR
ncbi:MAG TPA: hypothetical protein VJL29_16070 [Thermoguttaceae bacterium]|nr:hypothetical protein [Thermoguttaceae bacterium]